MFAGTSLVMGAVFFFFFFCNLSESVRKTTKWFCGVQQKVTTKSLSVGQDLYKRFESCFGIVVTGSRNICEGCVAEGPFSSCLEYLLKYLKFFSGLQMFLIASPISEKILEQLCQSENKISHKFIDMLLKQRQRFNTQTEKVNVELRKVITQQNQRKAFIAMGRFLEMEEKLRIISESKLTEIIQFHL